MSSALSAWILVAGLSTGQVIYEPAPTDVVPGTVAPGSGVPIYEEAGTGLGGSGDPLFPYDATEPWMHGYFQEIPAYGGYAHFRPHNYKHVFAQSQVSAGWGFSPQHPYSQQFWHRYESMSSMRLHLPSYPSPAAPRRPGQRPAVSDIYQQSYQQPEYRTYADPRYARPSAPSRRTSTAQPPLLIGPGR